MQYSQRLDQIEARFEDLTRQMADPSVIGDADLYRKTAKNQSELEEVVARYREWKRDRQDLEGARPMLEESDPELREMARAEVERLEPALVRLEEELKILLLPKDPNDEKDVVLEIRAGAGGDEASLFAAEIFRMYTRYAEEKKWRVELTSTSESSAGGAKEVIALISGNKVYSRMKYEGGVHRVQRVPVTEAQGRIHTSTVTVAVLPEAEDVEVQIDQKDLRIDVMRAGGPGGQSVNTTDSAVRITHLPSGLVVHCQDEKSQLKNRSKAMKILRARLLEMEQARAAAERAADRRSQVGTGDRAERIRTYNFPQSRVTDHRAGITLHKLPAILDGDLDDLLDGVHVALAEGGAPPREEADD